MCQPRAPTIHNESDNIERHENQQQVRKEDYEWAFEARHVTSFIYVFSISTASTLKPCSFELCIHVE
jgi:hypothetical protein